MIVDEVPKILISCTVEIVGGLAFGIPVIQGAADKAGRALATGDAAVKFVGISVRDRSVKTEANQYSQYESARVTTEGTIWVTAAAQAAVGDPVYFAPVTSAWTNVATGNVQVVGTRFDTSTTGTDQFAQIRLGQGKTMSRSKLLDTQAVLGFVVSQTIYIERQVSETAYPDTQYPQLISVDALAPEQIKTVTFYSADKVGRVDWVNGNADSPPLASTERSKFESSMHMTAIGYGHDLEEISQVRMLGINLTGDDAAAVRRAYEEFVDRVTLAGDASKNFSGLFNYPGVTVGSAVTGNWETATADQILADVNTVLILQTQGTPFTALSDTLLLPYAKSLLIVTRKVNEQGLETILTYLQKNNVYTAITGHPLTICGLNDLDAAGAGDTACMVSYCRDPSVPKMHILMPHRFLSVYQAGPIRWEVPSIFRLGDVGTRRPAKVRYTDGI